MAGTLKNKTVRLSQEQIDDLELEAGLDKRDISSLIRIAVDDMIEARRKARAAQRQEEPVAA